MLINFKLKEILSSTLLLTLLTACGGGSSGSSDGADNDSSNETTQTLEGSFIDAAVKGLRYKTATQSGYTDSEGHFNYQYSEKIEFFIGDLYLGSATAKEIMTPYTLAGDSDLDNPTDKTLNIALLLQNLDANRSNIELIDVEKFQNYKFNTLDLNVSSDSFETEVSSLLNDSSIQELIDTNTTLIKVDTVKVNLYNTVLKYLCMLTTITDDSNFEDNFPTDIEWEGDSITVEDIARVFNNARAKDSTISQELIMPSQEKWDAMSYEERGLYLLNNERFYRGIKPFEGISSRVSDVAQNYAQYLYDNGVFGHEEDGSDPWERLDSDPLIRDNKDFFGYAENLYAHGSSSHYVENPIAKAIYGFIYDDNASTGGSFGHRRFCLATELNDNSGESGKEGLIGFGLKRGTEYAKYDGYYSTIVVMNAFDPSKEWDHSTTQTLPFCTITNE